MKPRLSLIVLSLVAGACAACSDVKPFRCDIVEASCQRTIFQVVLRQRGDAVNPTGGLPDVETITPDQYRARLVAEQTAPSFDDLAWDEVLRLLHLLGKDATGGQASIDSAVENVAAFYSTITKSITVIDRQRPDDEQIGAMETLAHEIVHSIQDRELDLRRPNPTLDASFARSGLIEGDAVLYEILAITDFYVIGQGLAWEDYFDSYEQSLRDKVVKDESRFFTARGFVYPLGGRTAYNRYWSGGGNPGIRKFNADAPQASVAFMQPPAGEPPTLAPRCVPTMPAGFSLLGRDTFGAIQLFAVLAASLPEARAWSLAQGWTDDQLTVFRDPQNHVALFWQIQLRTVPTDAELKLLAPSETIRVATSPHQLTVAAASDAATLAAWAGASAVPACGGSALRVEAAPPVMRLAPAPLGSLHARPFSLPRAR